MPPKRSRLSVVRGSGVPFGVWLIAASALAGLDQWVKHGITARLPLGDAIPLWPGVLHIAHVRNTGAAFSLFEQHPRALMVLSVLLLGWLFLFLWRQPMTSRVQAAAFMLIAGGALGNLWDRLMRGAVVDYIDVVAIHFPIFNLADIWIFCGACLMVASLLVQKSTRSTS